jgi:hypothetical protein
VVVPSTFLGQLDLVRVLLFNPKDFITSLISFGEVHLRVSCDFIGAVRFFSILWPFASLCGVNILATCCAKSSDFSLSLLAQGPAVGVVARIGGEASFGFLLFLLCFHIA